MATGDSGSDFIYADEWRKIVENVNLNGVDGKVREIKEGCRRAVMSDDQVLAAYLLKAVTVIDLTTLSPDDTFVTVNRLCCQAAYPIPRRVEDRLLVDKRTAGLSSDRVTVAAVCVYPNRVPDAVRQLKRLSTEIPVASVCTGFPCGQYPLDSRLREVNWCLMHGAKEVDIVLDRSLVLGGGWKSVYDEVKAMVETCHRSGKDGHLKAILATGECGSLANVARASLMAMMAGANFIKTSTGKEAVNATLEVGLVMCRAIRFYYLQTGKKVGLKPAGGLKTWEDAVEWLYLVRTELGTDWLQPSLFRIGASSLLASVVQKLEQIADEMDSTGITAPDPPPKLLQILLNSIR